MPNESADFAMPSVQKLLAELETLNAHISATAPDYTGPEDDDAAFALFRVVRGLSPDGRAELERHLQVLPWLVLPLSRDALPALRQIQQKIDHLSHAAGHDDLTGLALRRIFEQTLRSEMERTRRSGLSLSMAILDIDDFKKINDICGHAHGDLVLRSLAEILRKNIRQSDLGVRLGGEEFALLMPATTQASATLLLERIMAAVRELRFDCPAPGLELGAQVTISAGLACYKGFRDLKPEEFVEMADQAMYQAKKSGKDRLEKAPFRDISPELSTQTLVDAAEKNFLFHTLAS